MSERLRNDTENEVKDVGRIRWEPDVKMLLGLAFRNLTGRPFKNINRIGNHALRVLLTPLVGNKKVRTVQKEMGVTPETNGK